MAKTQKAQVVITANAGLAKKIMDELRQRVDELKKQMEALDVTTAKGARDFKKLEQELASYNSAVMQNITSTERIDKVMKNLSNTSLTDLKRALAAAKSELGKMSASSSGLKDMQNNVKLLQGQIDKLTGATKKAEGGFSSLIRHGAQMISMYMGLNALRSAFTDITQGLFKFSDQLTDIRKVSGLTTEQIKDMSVALQSIDSRTSVEELNKYAYAGAKLGVATRAGVDGLVGFSKAANQLGTALHEDLGEDAIVQLSKMQEVMTDANSKGVEKGLLSIGSAIFKLSSTTTSNGANIVQFSKRLVGLAKASKMTTPQILALGSAADSMMLMPEVASTAMSKFITSIQTNWNLLEKDLNMKQGSLRNIIEKDGIFAAIMEILPKMKEKGGMNALNAMFKDMGSDGARLKNVLVTMSQNFDMLESHVRTATEAFSEGTAVTKEYNMQNQTAAALMERANNMWHKSFVNAEGVDIVKRMAQAWYEFTKAITNSEGYMTAVSLLLNGIVNLITTMLKLLPGLIAALMFRGVASAVMGVTAAIRGLSAGIAILKSLNFWMLAITAVVNAAIWAYDKFTASTKKAKDADQWMKDGDRERLKYFNQSATAINSYRKAIDDAAKGTKERATAISNFNKQFGSYMKDLLKETDGHLAVAKACAEVNKQMRLRFQYQQKQKEYDAQVGSRDLAAMDKLETYNVHAGKSSAYAGRNGDWLASLVEQLMGQGYGGAKSIMKVVGGRLGLTSTQLEHVFNSKPNATTSVTGANRNNDDISLGIDAYRYISQVVAARSYEKKWADRWKGVDLSNVTPDEQVNTSLDVSNPARDKDAEKAARLADQAQKKDWRDQLRQYQDEAVAMVDNVSNYFDRQLNEQLRFATEKGMTEAEKTLYTSRLTREKNIAMQQLRFALSGQNNSWDAVSAGLPSLMLERPDATGYNASAELLNMIRGASPSALRQKMAGVAGNLDKPMSALIAQIFNKGTGNETNNITAELKAQQARIAAELERNYTGKVQADYYDKFNIFGFAGLNIESEFDARKQAIMDMFEAARKGLVELISVGDEDMKGVFGILFGDDAENYLVDSPLSDLLDMTADDFKLFYDTLIQYSDAYTQAQSKAKEKQNTTNRYLWEHSAQYESFTTATQQGSANQKDMANRVSFGAAGGVSAPWEYSSANDPEIAMFLLRLQMAQEYYDFLKAHNADSATLMAQQEAITARTNDLSEAVIKKAKTQADAMKKWCAPIEEYGTAVGEALADDTKSVKQATGEMIKSFIKLTGEYVNQKITQWIMTKLYNGLMADEEQALVVQEQTAATQSVATQAAKTEANVALGEAEAGAKTLGELGWWGIPLIAVITAVLNGLLSFAMSKVSSAFGGGGAKVNTKLVSGMLTYDSGNVQTYAGSDGHSYSARTVGSLSTGVVTSPIATTVNGQPSLVGERGPEIVVGRETTAAIMRNDPGLLRMLVNYDRNYSGRRQVFDSGNVGSISTVPEVSASGVDMAGLMAAILDRLNNPVAPVIGMYGRDGLHSKIQQANQFMKNR